MPSGIYLPIDKVLSTRGGEWHGLAEPTEIMAENRVKELIALGKEVN